MIKKTVICDVDGVISNTIGSWLGRYNIDYNDNVQPSDITEWNTHKFLKPECGVKIYDYLEDPTLYDEVLPYSIDSLEFCNNMREAGWRIVFATVNPFASAGAKWRFLIRHGYLNETQKKDYVEIVDKTLLRGVADILIDDGVHNTKAWYETAGVPVLFQQSHNKKDVVPYFHTNDWNYIFDVCNGGYEL